MSCQIEIKGPDALSGAWGKGNNGIVCYKTDGAVRAHSAGPSSGADVRGGSLAPPSALRPLNRRTVCQTLRQALRGPFSEAGRARPSKTHPLMSKRCMLLFSESEPDFSRGCAHPPTRPPISATHPHHAAIREWLSASTTRPVILTSANLYSLLPHVVPCNKRRAGKWIILAALASGLCRIVHPKFGEKPFHALRCIRRLTS
jgi:hypothetical protein